MFLNKKINILGNEELPVDHFRVLFYCITIQVPNPTKVHPLHTMYTPSPLLLFSHLFVSYIPHLLYSHHHHNNHSSLFIVFMVIPL